MNAVFEDDVFADRPLFPERTRNRHNTRADVFNQSMRQIAAAAPFKTDLRIPKLCSVLSRRSSALRVPRGRVESTT